MNDDADWHAFERTGDRDTPVTLGLEQQRLWFEVSVLGSVSLLALDRSSYAMLPSRSTVSSNSFISPARPRPTPSSSSRSCSHAYECFCTLRISPDVLAFSLSLMSMIYPGRAWGLSRIERPGTSTTMVGKTVLQPETGPFMVISRSDRDWELVDRRWDVNRAVQKGGETDKSHHMSWELGSERTYGGKERYIS